MKDNIITLKDSKGKKRDYRVLIDVENTSLKVNFIVYTDEEKDKNGDVICYASTYVLSDKGNITKLKPVSGEEEFEFLSKLLCSLESEQYEKINRIIKAMAEQDNTNEQLKETNQLLWIGLMNNYKHYAEEIVYNEIIFS